MCIRDSFNLHLVEVGDLRLDALDCLRLVNRPDMKIDRDVAVHLKEVGKHTVIEFRREDLQEAHLSLIHIFSDFLSSFCIRFVGGTASSETGFAEAVSAAWERTASASLSLIHI